MKLILLALGLQAGELVEKYDINFGCVVKWHAWVDGVTAIEADTPTRAICLAVCASKYGDEVPEEME